jgi:hypothetical protein
MQEGAKPGAAGFRIGGEPDQIAHASECRSGLKGDDWQRDAVRASMPFNLAGAAPWVKRRGASVASGRSGSVRRGASLFSAADCGRLARHAGFLAAMASLGD